jgi:threonine aldolase
MNARGPRPIDLRSDTVTRPTPAMREAMARAEVGDDQFGEDPTINRLQERVAAMLGHEAALWLPTGVMANQVAIRALARPGDEVIIARGAHLLWFEAGGAAATSGVQLTELGRGGRFSADEFLAARKPPGVMYPPTTVVSVENTHNRAGGVVVPVDDGVAIAAAARSHAIASYLAGGAMRQVGIFAAAADHALDHHLDRLADDHANARLLADRLAASRAIDLDPTTVQTNIVVFDLRPGAPDAAAVIAAARDAGVLVVAFGPRTIRAVTHLDVTREQVVDAAERLVAAAESAAPG